MSYFYVFVFFFFFKQKTAYEMRISDWSSDVCSSDLSIEDEIVLQFCGSKKSLASGLPIASVLFPGPQLGLILLPLMLFHQIQLIVCAVLARHYGARADRHDSPPQPAY